ARIEPFSVGAFTNQRVHPNVPCGHEVSRLRDGKRAKLIGHDFKEPTATRNECGSELIRCHPAVFTCRRDRDQRPTRRPLCLFPPQGLRRFQFTAAGAEYDDWHSTSHLGKDCRCCGHGRQTNRTPKLEHSPAYWSIYLTAFIQSNYVL